MGRHHERLGSASPGAPLAGLGWPTSGHRGPASSKTARNIDNRTTVRIGVGTTRDVVMIDAVMESQRGAELDSALRSSYTAQAGWDPGRESGYVFLVLRPTRVQAWRERNEMRGRDLMVDGRWLV